MWYMRKWQEELIQRCSSLQRDTITHTASQCLNTSTTISGDRKMKYHFIEIMLDPTLTDEQCKALFDSFANGICEHERGQNSNDFVKDIALITREEVRLDD